MDDVFRLNETVPGRFVRATVTRNQNIYARPICPSPACNRLSVDINNDCGTAVEFRSSAVSAVERHLTETANTSPVRPLQV